ncbi:16S rRNA (adenine(1518)-N(6)/adenine(1519)-N(6))-dimethyltransferase RsmA, partial [Candidatus Gracilibacteria bacterium]|nr:16S rRNA (adenine(1518)-N(6)/adenine(1519)-N(6))-dimethyltransferase RsmA [Candidatus Gracilibacteria bacterium]
ILSFMPQNIIDQYRIRAKKSLGQNFLIDEGKLATIAQAIQVRNQNIIEVGPGYGALTEKLLSQSPKTLNLVELDDDMVHILQDRFCNTEFTLHHQDILKYNPDVSPYSVIANIPYYITSPILRHFLYDIDIQPESMVILMQKDVADKILGGKKDKTSVLRLFIEKKCSIHHVTHIPNTCFSPAPKVDSSVLLFQSHDHYMSVDDVQFLDFIQCGFAQPRKMLVKNLLQGGYQKDHIIHTLSMMGIGEQVRPEDLSISQWIELSNKI